MTSSRLFSILFNSFWLAIYYITSLKKNRPDSGGFALLIKTFVEGPKVLEIGSVQHHAGFCYVALLDKEYLSDLQGRSTLMLLENGNSLPLSNTRNLAEIVEKGSGRYLHVENKLFFSPLDNADKDQVSSRKYVVLDTLVNDQERVEALLALNEDALLKANPVLRVIEKLVIYFQGKVKFNGLADLGSNSYDIHKLDIDLNQWHLSNWSIKKLTVRYSKLFTDILITLNFEKLSIEGIKGLFSGNLKLEIDQNYNIRPVGICFSKDAISILNATLDWEDKALKKVVIKTDSVADLIVQLAAASGGNERDYSQWLEQFLDSITSNDMNINLSMDDETRQCLSRSLAFNSKVNSFELVAKKKEEGDNVLVISCVENMISESEL